MKDGRGSWAGGFDSKIDFKPGQKTRVARGEARLKSQLSEAEVTSMLACLGSLFPCTQVV